MTYNLKELQSDEIQSVVREAELKSGKQIVGLISHELRTPLSIISSNVQLLKAFNYNLDDKMVKSTFLLCEEAIGSLTNFIESVYFLHSAFKGEMKVQRREVELHSLIDNLVAKVGKNVFNKSRIVVTKEINGDPFFTDETLLKKCLENLLENALNFSSGEVRFKIVSEKNELVISIADRGIGFPPDEKEQVFEPFKRGSNVKMISGCGIGLAIVKICVDLLEGNLNLKSELNQGSEFIIKIRNHEC